LNGNNYDNWSKKMKVVLCYQDIWDLVKNGVTPNGDRTTNDQKAAYKELKNKDYKVLFTIHQCVDANNFESSKEA
jgi:hypothetical protein